VTLSIDTNVFVDLIRVRTPRVRGRLEEARAEDQTLVASLIVFHELHFGAERDVSPARQRANIDWVLSGVEIAPFDGEDMLAAARIRAQLAARGRPIGPYDLLIAGQALARGWTVVTANTHEFARIDGLNVIDWTAPAD
jgi:tRNA(fMet)-specific endonuclease VapC